MMQGESNAPINCWVVSDGRAGMEVQCLGLAGALGVMPKVKRIVVPRPWRWLPPLLVPRPLARLDPAGDSLAPPWPDLWIASGRLSVAPTVAVRRASGGRTFTVQIQNPVVDPARFDLVVAPAHDRLAGPNVIQVHGGLNQVSPAALAAAAERFAPRYAHLPRPLVAVIVGGNSKVHRLSEAVLRRLCGQLADLARREGAGLLVTTSRRTGADNEALLRSLLADLPAEIWSGEGENPYLGFLALADYLVVTGDSVNMVSEAASTGKPVFVVALEGGSAKFERFHAAMRDRGATRPFIGELARWDYAPLAETTRVADEVRARMAQRSGT